MKLKLGQQHVLMRAQWTETPMMRTQSCLVPWKGCAIPAPRDADNNVQPCKLEFYVLGPNKGEDRPFGGGMYELPAPGGYKLSHGTIRPYPQACQAPMMLVRCGACPSTAVCEHSGAHVPISQHQQLLDFV